MSLHNIYKTLCDGLGLAPVNGSFVQALGDYFGVVDNPNRRYEDEVLVQALINAGGPGTASVELFDTFGDFPLEGDSSTLYIAKDVNIIYRWDEILPAYVILNDPDVVNPDAPEEGGTFYVRLATSSALRTCTYNNGTAGVGATLTATANGVLGQTSFTTNVIDGIAAVQGDVILVKNQTARLQNGIYEVTQLGDVSNPFILTRIDGYDETAEIFPSIVFVSLGTANRNRYFTQSTQSPVIGTSNLIFNVATISSPASPLLFVSSVANAALPASTYAAGTVYATLPGWGATITANANGALGVINGVTMTSGMRMIVNGQVNQAHNGAYTVTNAGSATQRWVLTRWISDSSQWHLTREFTVSNPNSTVYGSRWSVSSPLSMANTAYGTTGIVFSQKNSTGLRGPSGDVLISPQGGESSLNMQANGVVDLRTSDGIDLYANNLDNYINMRPTYIELGINGGNSYIYMTNADDNIEIFAAGDVNVTGDIILDNNSRIDSPVSGTPPRLNLGTVNAASVEIGHVGTNVNITGNFNVVSSGGDINANNFNGIILTSTVVTGNGFRTVINGLPTYDSEALALAAGLTANVLYKTSTGELRIKL